MAIINGTSGNDTLSSGSSADSLYGFAGDDFIYISNQDTGYGGTGDDTLFATGNPNNMMAAYGEDGNDIITGAFGGDYLSGGDGDDSVAGGDGDDTILGGAGADTLDGEGGTYNILSYEDASAGMTLNLNNMSLNTGDAAGDVISNFRNVIGTDYADEIHNDGSIRSIFGGSGNDTMYTSESTIYFYTEAEGGAGADTIIGGSGEDAIYGGESGLGSNSDSGNNYLDGGDGDDGIVAGGHGDTLIGGNGNDKIDLINSIGSHAYGGDGDDTIDAGNFAFTTYHFSAGDDYDLIRYEDQSTVAGTDSISFDNSVSISDLTFSTTSGGLHLLVSYGDGDAIEIYDEWNNPGNFYNMIDLIEFSNGDSIDLPNATWGTDSAETINGTSSAEDIIALGGDDLVNAEGGADFADGGIGNDTLKGSYGGDTLNGGADDDRLLGQGGADVIDGGDGDDWLFGNDDLGELQTDGADTLNGGAGDDTILGNDGDDIITGGTGQDLMRGDSGADTFVFNSAADAGLNSAAEHDVIQLFSQGDGDQMDFSNMAEGTFTFVSGGNGRFDFTGAGNEIAFKEFANASRVFVDVDGDQLADMEINLVNNGAITLTASDFIL